MKLAQTPLHTAVNLGNKQIGILSVGFSQVCGMVGDRNRDPQSILQSSSQVGEYLPGRAPHGNENNLDQPDGVYYLGQGFSPGYGVVNLGAHYQIHKRVQLFVQIDNLLNHRYYTAAQLAPTPFDNAGNFVPAPFSSADGNSPIRASTFFAPGAPIGAWGGIRIKF